MTRDAVVNQAKAWLGLNENDGSHREVIDHTTNSVDRLQEAIR